MTPKEKAKQLYELTRYDVSTLKGTEALINEVAKRCALIAVDEIMNIKGNLNFDYVWYEQRQTDINNWLDTEGIIPIRIHALEYWQQVKEEINKL
jgi:hypothetical protein